MTSVLCVYICDVYYNCVLYMYTYLIEEGVGQFYCVTMCSRFDRAGTMFSTF